LNKRKSFYYALSSVALWSTVATAFKLTLRGMNNTQLLFYSSLTSTIILFLFAKKNSPGELKIFFSKLHLSKNAFLGLINPFIYYLVLFEAYRILPAQEAQPINMVWPLVLSILSAIFLKEKLHLSTFAGLIVSFTGLLIVATKGDVLGFGFHNLRGDLLAFLSSFIWAASWLINLFDKREESVKLFGSFFFGTIYTGIYILFFDSFGPVQINYLFGAVYIGIFEMGLTFFLWLKALSLSDNKAKTANIIYLFPIGSFSFIALVLGEKIHLSSIIGLVLIISGILIQQVTKEFLAVRFSFLRGGFNRKN
jgi:drug/metabolite transporter (DMT)-like permease